jgi:hypothetical protein
MLCCSRCFVLPRILLQAGPLLLLDLVSNTGGYYEDDVGVVLTSKTTEPT